MEKIIDFSRNLFLGYLAYHVTGHWECGALTYFLFKFLCEIRKEK